MSRGNDYCGELKFLILNIFRILNSFRKILCIVCSCIFLPLEGSVGKFFILSPYNLWKLEEKQRFSRLFFIVVFFSSYFYFYQTVCEDPLRVFYEKHNLSCWKWSSVGCPKNLPTCPSQQGRNLLRDKHRCLYCFDFGFGGKAEPVLSKCCKVHWNKLSLKFTLGKHMAQTQRFQTYYAYSDDSSNICWMDKYCWGMFQKQSILLIWFN